MSRLENQDAFLELGDLEKKCATLERKLARERKARQEAEKIAEEGLRDLFLSRERLELLNRITQIANESREPNDALLRVTKEICVAMDWAMGHVLRIRKDEDGHGLDGTNSWYSNKPDRMFPFFEVSRKMEFETGASAPGRLLANPTPVWTGSIHKSDSFPRSPTARSCGLRSSIAMPIKTGTEVVAAIEFFLTEQVEPSPEILDLLNQIGVQVGRVFKRFDHNKQLHERATTDPLTGLPNRLALDDDLGHHFDRAKLDGTDQLVLVYLDLDGFKLVNDTLGHQAGDNLLAAMSQRVADVASRFAEYESVELVRFYRAEGDEFVLLLVANDAETMAEELAKAIHEDLRSSFAIDENEVKASANIGIAKFSPEYTSRDELLRDANVATYNAKMSGTSRTATFCDTMRQDALKSLTLQVDLRNALAAFEFELHFQPVVGLSHLEIVGFEALIRWRKMPDELVFPDHFIPAAERHGLIVPIGMWVLREACRTAVRWRSKLPKGTEFYIGVNVAAQHFQQSNFVEQVRDIFLETAADPVNIKLELTESTAVTNIGRAARTLDRLRAMGVRSLLDDFGTGYSALSHLQTMSFDTLKIDRSFISEQTEEKADWSIVAAMAQLGASLDMDIIVEGIENQNQLDELQKLGCEFGQGWFFDKALVEIDALSRLQSKHD